MSAACSEKSVRSYEVASNGVRLCIDDSSGAYEDITASMRRGDFDKLMRQAPKDKRYIAPPEGISPMICDVGRSFPKALNIQYGPRSEKQVGATLKIYFKSSGKVGAAEFYVIPLAL
jgi:hypothetical protein